MNRFSFLFALMFGFAQTLLSQTTITSDITSSSTWTVAGSPYILDVGFSGFDIVSGVTLTIEPGVEVQGPSTGVPINVKGSLVAIGTPTDSIVFTGIGGSDWAGMTAYGDDGNVSLDYVSYLSSDVPFDSIAYLSIKNSFIEPGIGLISSCGIAHFGSTLPGEIIIEACQFGTAANLMTPEFVLFGSHNFLLSNSIMYAGGLLDCRDGIVEYCTFYEGGDNDNQSILYQYNLFNSSATREIALDADIQMLYNIFEPGSGLQIEDPVGLAPTIIKYNQFCDLSPFLIRFNTSPLVTDVDLSENCWCSTDTVDIMNRFSIASSNPNPNLPAITLSPLSTICLPNQVYPGDANYNQLANAWDLLAIGTAYGTTGPIRPMASTTWIGQDAPDWTDSLADGTNFKHVDCNGDGLIDSIDVQAIISNYSSTHLSQRPFRAANGLPLYTDQLPSSLLPGDTIEFLTYLGTMDTLAQNVYGIAFGLSYDTSLVKPGGISVEFDTTWIGTEGTDLLTLAYDDFENGRLEMAQVRTDQMDVSGFGAIAKTIVVLDDDISKKEIEMILRFEEVQAIGADEQDIPVSSQDVSAVIIASIQGSRLDMPIEVFPNPAKDILSIRSAELPIQSISLYSMSGQLIYQSSEETHRVDVSVGAYPNGLYLLSVHTDKGILRKKIVLD